jgi:hypothetical protein
MVDQFHDLLRAGVWLGPAVLGALCFRLLADHLTGDDLAGAVMLATAAVIWTVAGVREHHGKPAIAPIAFVAMFLASWSMR